MKYLNIEFYTYYWPKDPRKNLIERSHRSDDEEFIIPRWYFINSKKDFLKRSLRLSILLELWKITYLKVYE